MKNVRKKFLALTLATMMLFATISSLFNKSYADEEVDRNYFVPNEYATEYQFHARDVLVWAAKSGTGQNDKSIFPFIIVAPTEKQFEVDSSKSKYPEYIYLKENEIKRGEASRGRINANDASNLLTINGPATTDDRFMILTQLCEDLGVDPEDIVLNVRLNFREKNENVTFIKRGTYNSESGEYGWISEDKQTANAKIEKVFNYCKEIFLSGKYGYMGLSGDEDKWNHLYDEALQEKIADGMSEEDARYAAMVSVYDNHNKGSLFVTEVDAILPDGVKYCLVVAENGKKIEGTDVDYRFWALARKGLFDPGDDPTIDDPVPTKPTELKTTLDYVAIDGNDIVKQGSDSPFLAPYTENDIDKKDTDVIAYIRSTTKQDIVKTNGVDIKTDGSANSEGWYYPSTNDKTVIAKLYPFDKYDNTNDNGIAKEEVTVSDENDLTSNQIPYIKWTFRRVRKDIVTNDDKSTTVTITFNLPVDKDSIPDGWSPKYDSDGTTIHAITRNFKNDESYNKDVVVKQNGTGEEVTTHVSVAPNVLAKTGESAAVIFAILAVAIVAIRLYGKNKKFKKMK